jgi:hypothetical protein
MGGMSLTTAAVLTAIIIGFFIGICLFYFGYLYVQSVRGKDVAARMRRVQFIILSLFAVFIGIFAVMRWFF